MLCSFEGDKHEFCLVVIKFWHVHSSHVCKAQALISLMHDCIERSSSDILSCIA